MHEHERVVLPTRQAGRYQIHVVIYNLYKDARKATLMDIVEDSGQANVPMTSNTNIYMYICTIATIFVYLLQQNKKRRRVFHVMLCLEYKPEHRLLHLLLYIWHTPLFIKLGTSFNTLPKGEDYYYLLLLLLH